jgi:excisionase family DNA binding protein
LEKRYLTARDVAQLLNRSIATIYAYTSENSIPYIKLRGKLLFVEKDILEWLENESSKNRLYENDTELTNN